MLHLGVWFKALFAGMVVTIALIPSSASAAPISFTPSSIDTTGKVSPSFGAATYVVTDDYDAFGVRFSNAGIATALFLDPPLAWGGINAQGVVDLLAPVQGRVVLPGTGGLGGQTSRLSIEAGVSAVGSLLLQAYDCNGRLLAATVNDDGFGPNGRTLMTLAIPGIHSITVSTPAGDSFGVNSIQLEQPIGCVVNIRVDVRPGSTVNPVNLKSKGVIPVAVISTVNFDATKLDASHVCFGDAEQAAQRDCTEAHGKGHVEDVNGDGRADLVLHFNTQETGIDPGDTRACLNGSTVTGERVQGCDVVRVFHG